MLYFVLAVSLSFTIPVRSERLTRSHCSTSKEVLLMRVRIHVCIGHWLLVHTYRHIHWPTYKYTNFGSCIIPQLQTPTHLKLPAGVIVHGVRSSPTLKSSALGQQGIMPIELLGAQSWHENFTSPECLQKERLEERLSYLRMPDCTQFQKWINRLTAELRKIQLTALLRIHYLNQPDKL